MQDFIDAPVKTYSSGMYMRLGFAVAIHVDPDVLLVDEVLAVGDQGFTHKCLDKFAEFRRRNKIDPAGHPLAGPGGEVLRRGALARQGRHPWRGRPEARGGRLRDQRRGQRRERASQGGIRARGRLRIRSRAERRRADFSPAESPVETPAETLQEEAPLNPADEAEQGPKDGFKSAEGRWGTREVEITGVSLHGPDGEPGHVFQSGDAIEVRMQVHAAPTGDRLRVRRGLVQRRRRVLSTAPTPTSKSGSPRRSAATAKCAS